MAMFHFFKNKFRIKWLFIQSQPYAKLDYTMNKMSEHNITKTKTTTTK